jgi:hypothetical protein
VTYPTEKLLEEVAYVAYHFNWSRDEILDLEHQERRHYVEQIERIQARSPRR